jgi:hypothetical protein
LSSPARPVARSPSLCCDPNLQVHA